VSDGEAPARPGATVWFTGLSGSGKSTIAAALAPLLSARGLSPLLLDGDDLRGGLNADLGFSPEDRAENVRRVGEVALLLARNGIVALVPVISPYREYRSRVRGRHDSCGAPFFEVYVATPLEVCESRDPKGHYARARRGELAEFTGVSAPYEAPEGADLVLETSERTPEQCAGEVLGLLAKHHLIAEIL